VPVFSNVSTFEESFTLNPKNLKAMGKSFMCVSCGKRRRIIDAAVSGMNARWFYHPILP
jgi:hypothetical protein